MPQLMFDDEDGTLALLRDSVQGFSAEFPGPTRMRARRAAGADLDCELWSAMAEAGWLGVMIPEDLGGAGLGAREQAVLSEALGRAMISEPIAFLSVFSGALLSAAAEGAVRDRLIGALIDGSEIIAPAVQGVSGAVTPLDFANGSLNGTAHYVNAAASATTFLVVGRDGEELVLLAVSADQARVELRPTLDGSQLGKVEFCGAHVAADQILLRGALVSDALDKATDLTRIALAAELAGLASAEQEMTVAYTSERVQFGKPIAAFQALQHRMVDMWADAEFACAAVVNACERLNGSDAKASALAILAAKARAGDAAVTVGRRAIHLFGAMGFTDECDIGHYMKRATALNAALGQPEALRLEFVALERAA